MSEGSYFALLFGGFLEHRFHNIIYNIQNIYTFYLFILTIHYHFIFQKPLGLHILREQDNFTNVRYQSDGQEQMFHSVFRDANKQ